MTFWPSKVISLAPFSTNWFASINISSDDRENSAPLVYGTTQNLQNLSQPSCIVKKEEILLLVFLREFKVVKFTQMYRYIVD